MLCRFKQSYSWLLLVIIISASNAFADFQSAITAYNNGNYPYAAQEFRRLAELGDIVSANNLGHCYELGLGVPKNPSKAFELYMTAAKRGYAQAQCNIGVMYERGSGAPRDIKQAAYWYEMGARSGNPRAQYNTGICYMKGLGVQKDLETALMWFIIAKESGHPKGEKAMNSLRYKATRQQRENAHIRAALRQYDGLKK